MNPKSLIPMSWRYRVMQWRGRSVYSGYPDKHRCVFIHIPKTAGTSVVDSLFGQDSRHARWSVYQQANPKKFQEYFKFCFVRNPWDRLLSAYLFLRRGGMNEADAAWAQQNLADYDEFESFVLNWVNDQNIWKWVHFRPQYDWICDENQQCLMDFVGRMESIDADFQHVADRLRPSAKLPVKNRTRTDHYSTYYTDAMRDIVARVYRVDIQMFDYEFGEER